MKVLLGVTGGIAAYKACDVARRLMDEGADVKVVMTDSAQRFVTKLTLQVLSGNPVATSLFDVDDPEIEHIKLARWPDVICVAPGTANTLARFAHGLADDLLSTIWLASKPEVPVVIAPAMNTVMWEAPPVQRNLSMLRETGRVTFVEPAEKTLACGETGTGALAEVPDIVAAVTAAAANSQG